MKRIALLASLLVGCSWFSNGGGAQVASDVGKVGACIIGQALSGDNDPTQIAQACSPATISDIEQIVQSLISYYETSDAGVPNAKLMARLQDLHSAAKAKLASGAK